MWHVHAYQAEKICIKIRQMGKRKMSFIEAFYPHVTLKHNLSLTHLLLKPS